MLEGPSDPYKQPDKLILPAPPTQPAPPIQGQYGQYGHNGPQPGYSGHTEQVQAGRLIHKNQHTAPPAGPLHTRLAYLWRKDPAYKVLFIAIGVVLISSIVCVTLLAGFVTQLAPPPTSLSSTRSQATPTAITAPTSQATATQAAEPTPIPTPTAVMLATPEPIATAPVIIQSTPNPGEKLTVQIGTLPEQINNNTTIPITVSTNRAGATVFLSVIYSAIPLFYASGPQTTDANGSATFSWTIHERTFSPFTRMISASITAMARDQDNQQASSPTVTVHILTR
ncbi:MAG: hypothetical protein NVS2B12_03070 [Ktedonobacteraceae bacterium]